MPRLKRETKGAHAYSVEEVEAILKAAHRPRDIGFLRTVYGCGLRVMEAVTLRARGGIDRARMQIRVEGKGAKQRVLPMSPHLLHVLEEYWLAERKGRPGHGSPWLFLGEDQQSPICGATGRSIYYRALKKSGVRPKGGIHVDYAIVLPLIPLRVGWNSPWYSASAARPGRTSAPCCADSSPAFWRRTRICRRAKNAF